MENGKLIWTDLIYNKAENFTIQADNERFETILSENISSVDQNSTLIIGESISNHYLNALSINQETAISVLKFTIADSATFDNLPTIINTAIFYKKELANSFDWKKHIAGAIIKKNGELIASSSDIEGDYIRFNSSKGILHVDNGTSQNFELAIYFRESQLPDNKNLQVYVPQNDLDWKTGVNSSKLIQTLSDDIITDTFRLNILADRLKLVSSPLFIQDSSEYFNLKAIACDQYQNIDEDYTAPFNLEQIVGDGELIHENLLEMSNGLAELKSIKYTGSDHFKLKVYSDLGMDTVGIIVGKNILNLFYNFETSNVEEFLNANDWSISTYQPIKGEKSLKHNLSNQIGNSYISQKIENWNKENGAIRWSFILRNGDWDPSSGNNFIFHLCMDNKDPGSAKIKYSVGVNLKGATDLLSFWKTDEDQNHELITQTNFNWNEGESVAIQVDYYPNGKWCLAYNRLGEDDEWYQLEDIYSEIENKSDTSYCGLEYHFETASRAGELWLDNLKVQSVNTAPFIKSYQVQGQDSILIAFSENLNIDKALTTDNIMISYNNEELDSFSLSRSDMENEILLIMNTELTTGHYRIKVLNITDPDGAILLSDEIDFEYLAPAKAFDVVINEIMADESPNQGLPEFEYVELYNTNHDPISLDDWILQIGEKKLFFSTDTIQADSYLILCSNSAVESFSDYTKVLGLSNFSGLTNSGNSLKLISAKELIIDEINYSDTWYKSDEKNNGGWSLERIDPENHSWQEPNWTASISDKGGTPGSLNSVSSDNMDNTSPEINGVYIQRANSVVLTFTEPMQENQASLETNYLLQPGNISANQIRKVDRSETQFEIIFTEQLIENSKYKLVISENVTDLAGNQLKNNQQEFWMPASIQKGDIIINELLFNPLSGGSDYVELYNRTNNIYNLSQLYLGKKDENYMLIDSVKLSENHILLHPKEYSLFSADTLHVAETYFTSNSTVFHQVDLPNYPDKGGRLVLFTKTDLIDDLEYTESMHFELLASTEGVALERINPENETNEATNWQSAAQNVGFGTPGLKNSVYSEEDVLEDEVSLSSKVFSPDNDGIDDRLYINFKLHNDGFVANIIIYNSKGKEIRKLASNLYLGKEDRIFWDGLSAKRERLPVGIYLVYIEMFSPKGEVRSFKKTCVIGGKFK